MNVTILNCVPGAVLLVVWFVYFVVLTDFNCPIVNACFACPPFWGRKKLGRGRGR